MKLHKTFELTFTAAAPAGGWSAVPLKVIFEQGDNRITVPAFYDGDGVFKARFLPEKTGKWAWHTEGMLKAAGEEDCADAGARGRVRAVGTHLYTADGRPFYPFGTTVYALASQDDALVEETLTTLKTAPFNKVRMCVFPKDYDYNHNEPPFYAFEKKEDGTWDTDRPCIAFWHRFEKILNRISEMGIEIDLILFHPYDRWGFSKMNMADNLRYLDVLQARLSAMPNIWWSLANEYDLFPHLETKDWFIIEERVAENDPYGHMLSNHNCTAQYPFERPNVTHCCIQSSWVENVPGWIRRYGKPVLIDEMCYEGNIQHSWGNISAFEMVNRFWCVCAGGGYATHGETYMDENEILWWARGGKLKGESPKRIAFLREVLEGLPGPLSPAPVRGLEALDGIPAEQIEGLKNVSDFAYIFARGIARMEPDMKTVFFTKGKEYLSQVEDKAYLRYMGRCCASFADIELPEDKKYRIEVIDAWNMTRETVTEGASGKTRVNLPGREGMAILATVTE